MPDMPDSDHTHREEAVSVIGISLLTGFALMLLFVLPPPHPISSSQYPYLSIESLTPHPPHSPPSSPASTPGSQSTPLNPLSPEHSPARPPAQHMNSTTPIITKRMHVREAGGERRNGGGGGGASAIHGLNATLGLVIHGAADGIALGASSLAESGSLSLIVFLAVLVHKGKLSSHKQYEVGISQSHDVTSIELMRNYRPHRSRTDHDPPLPLPHTAPGPETPYHLLLRSTARRDPHLPLGQSLRGEQRWNWTA